MQEAFLDLTSDIVSAHVSNNAVSAEQLPQLITAIYASLSSLGQEPKPIEEERTPAVSIRASVKPGAIACLECGAKQKTLKRHLAAQHNLSPDEYRTRWKLPSDYPLVSADYAAKRAELAIQIGLGSKGGRKKKAVTPVSAKSADKPAQTKVPLATVSATPQPGAAKVNTPETKTTETKSAETKSAETKSAEPKRTKAAKAAAAPKTERKASRKDVAGTV